MALSLSPSLSLSLSLALSQHIDPISTLAKHPNADNATGGS